MGRPAKSDGSVHANRTGWRWALYRAGKRLWSKTWATKEQAAAELAKVVADAKFVPEPPVAKRSPGSGHIATVHGGYRWETYSDKTRRYGRVCADRKDAEEELAKVLADDDFIPQSPRRIKSRRSPEVIAREKATETRGESGSEGLSREALIASGMLLAKKISNQQIRKARALRVPLAEDINAAALEGLIEAADKFDPSRGAKFLTYAGFRIRGSIIDYFRSIDHVSRDMRRKEKNDKTYVPEPVPISLEGFIEEHVRAESHLPSFDPIELVEQREFDANIRVACSKLPERLQTVLAMYYFHDLNLKEIGEHLGVTESRACQLMSEARLRLRVILEPPPRVSKAA